MTPFPSFFLVLHFSLNKELHVLFLFPVSSLTSQTSQEAHSPLPCVCISAVIQSACCAMSNLSTGLIIQLHGGLFEEEQMLSSKGPLCAKDTPRIPPPSHSF